MEDILRIREGKMKICLLTRTFNLKGGGIGRVSAEIRDGLIRRGHEVHCVSTQGEGLVSYFNYTMFQLPRKIPRGMDVYHALTPMESIWIPKEKGVSIILDLIALTHPGQYGGRLGVTTFHDIFPVTHPNLQGAGVGYSRLKTGIAKRYFDFACRCAVKCQYVVTVSEHVKDEVTKYFGVNGDKVKVIKSGIRSDLEPRPKPDNVRRVGYLAQLDRRKRVHLLIDAFKKSDLDELVIGGKGLDEKLLQQQAADDRRIKFVGFVPDDKLAEFYNSLDVFVFPTAIEGYGLPIVEAMACKKPVLVLTDAIIPRDVKDRCVVVNDLDDILNSRIMRLLGRVDVEDNYRWAKTHDWGKSITQYEELYEQIAGR